MFWKHAVCNIYHHFMLEKININIYIYENLFDTFFMTTTKLEIFFLYNNDDDDLW